MSNSLEDRADSPALKQAIHTWKQGTRINCVLAMQLMNQGYDVTSLEQQYLA